MEKTYQPQQLEDHWYKTWESRGYFAPSGDGDPYCIVIPPPNVTGRLHMGHGFQHAIMDALTAHTTMSKQALDSEKVRQGLKDVLLGPAKLYEALRGQHSAGL